ncbi:MBL fold metallo-hydrolase [Niabella sp. CC-SYL272]|uniref:ComEC/Rec2 family competence protein n=1 Tax=Niabella agricola TaxID=2891571 RepID=UPI001F4580F6|nr:MBL fold metallo-hydrolase [Niabella agricola]MCF3109555.1 MBL fold metallo-hydrolase [Niabella agricola]
MQEKKQLEEAQNVISILTSRSDFNFAGSISIKFLSVFCGDAILIRYESIDNRFYNILIDSGFVKTYKSILKPELLKIKYAGEKIDIVIGTHYDGDHIGGLLAFVNDKDFDLLEMVERWMINFDLPLADPQGAVSIRQLLTLKTKLKEANKLNEEAITTRCTEIVLAGLSLIVLSPDSAHYEKAKDAVETESRQIARSGNDYHITIDEFSRVIHVEHEEDDSVANGSSIALLLRAKEYSSLLLGDAFPSVICQSIRNLGYNESSPLIVDSLKLSHHASKFNISNELLSIIKCSNYLISANAINRYNLPHKESIARILLHSARNKSTHYRFYFTTRNKILEEMFLVDGSEIFNRLNFSLHFPDSPHSGILLP